MFDYTDLKPYLTVQLTNRLNTDIASFNILKTQAIEVVKRYVYIDEAAVYPKSLLLPTAWIITYIFIQTNDSINEEDRIRYIKLYDQAIELLKLRSNDNTGYNAYSQIKIEGLNEW